MPADRLPRALVWVACAGAALLLTPRRAGAAACVPIGGSTSAGNWYCDPFVADGSVEVDGTEPLVPSFPDAATRYAVIAYKFKDKTKVLRIHGSFASARFENLNVELFTTTGSLYTRVGNVVINDYDQQNESRRGCKLTIDANCGPDLVAASGCNPATSPNPAACHGDPYEVALVDAASATAWKNLHANQIITVIPIQAPPADVTAVRVAWRVANGGNASAPGISWETTAGAGTSGPAAPDLQNDFAPETVTLGVAPCGTSNCAFETYHIDPGPGQLHNYATEYVGATVKLLNASTDVVVLKFRAADSAINYPATAFDTTDDFRYWSACLGYDTTTTITSPTLGCSRDQDNPLGTPADGYERVVIGPETNVSCPGMGTVSLATCAQSRRHHYVSWGSLSTSTNRVFLYRNVMTNPAFPGAANQIPACTGNSCLPASSYVGSWAPRGKHCALSTYLSSPASCEAF